MSVRVNTAGGVIRTDLLAKLRLMCVVVALCSLSAPVWAAQPPILSDIEFSPSDTPLTTESVTLSADANSPDNLPLRITWNFGDGTESASGAVVQHTFIAAGDYIITVSVSDGVNPLVVKTAHIQAIAPALPGGIPGVNQGETQTDPDNGVTSAVLSSVNGVVELQISEASTSSSVGITTDFGDGSRIVNGAHPRHAYTAPGIYIATSTVADENSESELGKVRKTLVISAKDVQQSNVAALAGVANLSDPSTHVIAVTALSGKFNLGSSSKVDLVTATFVVELPAGLPLLQSHELTLSIGNVAETITINRKGNGQGAQQYKKVKVTWPGSSTNMTSAGQSATISVQLMSADLVDAGFDTEGISNTPKRVAPTVQFGMLLEGIAWTGTARPSLKLSKRGDTATLSTK